MAARRWLLPIVGATHLALLADVIYVYFVRFRQLVHSDAAALVLLAKSALDTPAIIPTRWYWGNGDVWLFGAPLTALPVAIGGVGVGTLRFCDLFLFAVEWIVFVASFRSLGTRKWAAMFAASVALVLVSRMHLVFVYVELAYGFIAMTFVAVIVLFASAIASPARASRLYAAIVLTWLVSACNPQRFLVYGLAPLLVACAWPWQGISARARSRGVAAAVLGWASSWLTYHFVFERVLTFSPERGHEAFAIQSWSGIAKNLVLFGRGVVALSGDPGGFSLAAIPGLVFLLGAIAVVAAHTFGSRGFTRTRFFGLALLVQLVAIAVPLCLGNLMLNDLSARYLLPATMPILGLAVVILCERVAASSGHRLAWGWLALAPVMAVLGCARMVGASIEAANAQWSNRAGHAALADALVRRHLERGFATYWNASLVTLLSSGRTKTCPVFVNDDGFVPQRWAIDTGCFDRATLPERFYVVANREERDKVRGAEASAFPPPIERFTIGTDEFEVSVFDKAASRTEWLDLPLPRYGALRLPLELAALHGAIRRAAGKPRDGAVVATGEPGAIVFGPFVALTKGRYRATWTGEGVASPGEIAFDVYANGPGNLAVTRMPAASLVGKTALATVPFDLAADTPDVEMRVHSSGGARVILRALRIERDD